jgi:hypothetical protein
VDEATFNPFADDVVMRDAVSQVRRTMLKEPRGHRTHALHSEQGSLSPLAKPCPALGQQAFLTQGAGRTGVPAAVVLALKLFRCSSNALTSILNSLGKPR